MIITSVHAKNVLRYAELRLTPLPRRGMIGISGTNESGKTTIAEIICLALFGRTFSHPEDDLQKNIKWGEFSAFVTVGFLAKGGHSYLITRSFDADGNHLAQLRREGEAEPFVRGAAAVNEHVAQLCGFTYQRFIDSFYLAQRNIASPSILLLQTAKALAGVETFEHVATECEHDIAGLQEALAPLHGDLAEARRQRAELNIQADVLPTLQAERNAQTTASAERKKENTARHLALDRLRVAATQVAEQVKKTQQATLDTSLEQWRHYAEDIETATQSIDAASEDIESGSGPRLTGALRSWRADLSTRLQAFTPVHNAAAAYRQHLAWLIGQGERPAEMGARARALPDQRALLLSQDEDMRKKRTGPILGFFVTLLLLLLSGGGLWFLNHMPDHAIGQWLSNELRLQLTHNSGLFFVALVSSGLSLVLLVVVFLLTERMLTARQEAARLQADQDDIKAQLQSLDALPQQSLVAERAVLDSCDDGQLKAALTQFVQGPGAALLEAEALSAFLAPLEAAHLTCQEEVEALTRRSTEEIRSVEVEIAVIHPDLERLEQAMTEEERRLNQAGQLDQKISTIAKDIDGKTRSVEVRRIAHKLLAGSHRRLLGRFNLEMRHVVSKILPKLTEGRYETMQIDNDLNVRVWSSEKGNFVDLNEISGGAYNQVMLAIRLALSQALITSSGCGVECLILDEPFAFFDAQRTQKTLAILPQVSPEIEQMWIIAQQFDDSSPLALHLHCSRDSAVLSAPVGEYEALEEGERP